MLRKVSALNNFTFKENLNLKCDIVIRLTRKYPLRGYILSMLTHTTTWDKNWGGDQVLKRVVYNMKLKLASLMF